MRDISATLKAAQQALSLDALVKIVLTHGVNSYTYDRDRILDRNHPEEPWSQKATVVLDNSDGVLTNLALQGFKGVISYGTIGSAGEEYSACAPLWVIGQQLNSSPGNLDCVLSLIGIPNLLAFDKASRNYIPDEDDTKTIETLLIEILGASLGCFSHCKAYQVVIDSRDSLINTYKPKDSLRIYKGNSRLAIAKGLLDCTGCVMLAKADGKLHIFVPTTSGVVYDSQYSLESGHTFFSKAYRKTLVIPNYIYASSPPHTVPNWVTVTSAPYSGEAKDQADIDKFGERRHTTDFGAGNLGSDAECAEYAQIELDRYIALHDPYYEGIAKDQESIDAIGEIRAYWQASFESDAQAKQVAEARLSKYKLNAEMGAGDVPINVGAEVYDYIKVAALNAEDVHRVGTMGSLTRHYNAYEAEWRMTFSLGQRPEAVDVMAAIEEDAPYFGRLIVDNLYAKNILADSLDMYWIDPEGNIDLSKIGDDLDNLPDGELYARVKSLHMDAGQVKLDEHILYKSGYDPNTKRRNFTSTPTTPYDLGDMWTDGSVLKRCTTARATGAYVAGDWTQVSIDEINDGAVFQRVKSAALTAAGLIILDQVEEGTYGLVYSADLTAHHLKMSAIEDYGGYGKLKLTDIEAGHIKLTSYTQVVGEWYNESGVEIDAAHGINIYGEDQAFTTRRTKTGTIQCKVDSYGRIVAGAGAVLLSADGIIIKGEMTRYQTAAGVTRGYVHVVGEQLEVQSVGTHLVLRAPSIYGIKMYGLDAYLYLPLTAQGIYTNHLYDIHCYNTTTWLGESGKKFQRGYFANLPACPVPTSNSALGVLKKIKAPEFMDGEHGKRHYFRDADFPSEMKCKKAHKDKDGNVVEEDEEEIEFVRTIGILVQSVRELTDKVEALEAS